jgi:hypothetical protein
MGWLGRIRFSWCDASYRFTTILKEVIPSHFVSQCVLRNLGRFLSENTVSYYRKLLLMFCFMTLLLDQNVQHLMVAWVMKDELVTSCMEAVEPKSIYSTLIPTEELRKTMKNFGKNNRLPSEIRRVIYPEYKLGAQLHKTFCLVHPPQSSIESSPTSPWSTNS